MNRPKAYLDHMVEAASLACSFVEGMSLDDFLADKRTQQAVLMNLIILGEAATKLSVKHPEFISQHAEIPWNSMKGMRNRVAHGYFEIDVRLIWETVLSDLPALLALLRKIS